MHLWLITELTISKRSFDDGLADRTLAFAGVATYGFILLVNYCMNYLDNYPENRLEHGIYLSLVSFCPLEKISTIDYAECQK